MLRRSLLIKLLTRSLQPYWNKLLHRHFDFACTFKEIFRFSKIFIIPLKAASNFILWWTLSKNSKYVPTGNHWGYTSIFKILCSCGLGKLYVNNKLLINNHLPKILIFQQLPLKHFLRHLSAGISSLFKTVNLFFIEHYNTSSRHERHERHECVTKDISATRVRHEQHECDTSATRTTRVQHECYTNDTSAPRVRNSDFDNDTSENIFTPLY